MKQAAKNYFHFAVAAAIRKAHRFCETKTKTKIKTKTICGHLFGKWAR